MADWDRVKALTFCWWASPLAGHWDVEVYVLTLVLSTCPYMATAWNETFEPILEPAPCRPRDKDATVRATEGGAVIQHHN